MVADKFNHDSPREARARGWNAGAFGILHILGSTAGLPARRMREMCVYFPLSILRLRGRSDAASVVQQFLAVRPILVFSTDLILENDESRSSIRSE
jgi:hypothetical protein